MAISATSLSNQALLEINSKSTTTVTTLNQQTDDSSVSAAQETVSISSSETSVLTYGDPRKAQSATTNDSGTDTTSADGATDSTSSSSGSASGTVDLASMIDASNQKVQQFIDMLGNMLKQQGLTWSKVVSGEQTLTADPKTVAAAKQAISPDGEFGIKNTAERILNFAKAAAGNDPSKLSQLRDAIQSGFDSAAQFFGGKLPAISNQTHDVIMNELDKWTKDGIPSGDVSLSQDDIDAVTNPPNDGSGASTSGSASADSTTTTSTPTISTKA
ncbi:hypothetical protein [Silvimonas sp.]|uniref:hypothetical protein n=1 Tax=Silvimonas sp. TaxID=2650811 RepID=UPI002846F86A|nr:hypothetical protein [Silvimonas sp.]MDR3429366.1 hypothetical protein [Silvimonas sp.]